MTDGENLTANQRRYAKINDLWPDPVPPLTDQEAIGAAKRLYRIGMGKAFDGSFKIVSGNRHTWIRNGVFCVNPSRGWQTLVHSISHLAHYRKHPGKGGHHWTHIGYERMMTEAVINNGWLDGTLRREAKPRPDVRAVRHQRVLARIKSWETKKKRAETALAKLYKSKTYYEKV